MKLFTDESAPKEVAKSIELEREDARKLINDLIHDISMSPAVKQCNIYVTFDNDEKVTHKFCKNYENEK